MDHGIAGERRVGARPHQPEPEVGVLADGVRERLVEAPTAVSEDLRTKRLQVWNRPDQELTSMLRVSQGSP